MKKQLYTHQKEAVKAALIALKEGETPYLEISIGGGKSLIIADLMNRAMNQGLRVLSLVPSKELCEQNALEASEYIDSPKDIGICCSKLNRFQVHRQSVIATYTSFLRRRATSGKFDVLLVDEAHGVGYEPTSSYRKIITSLKRINPELKIIGVTATPVRMASGRLEEKYLDFEPIFTKCAYQSSIPDLIKQGVLSNITSISGDIQVDLSGVPIKGGDYDTEISAVRFDAILPHAIPDLKLKIKAYGIETILIFASNVANARKIIEEWDGDNIRLIYGDMSQHDRSATIKWLKHGEGLRVVVNVNVLLVGFNFQKLDAVCFLRATKSLALYRQAVGRVLRSHEDKKIGFVIDYAGNIDEHGSIDGEIPAKNRKRAGEIPKKSCIAIVEETVEFEGLVYRRGDVCNYPNLLSARKCRVCGAEFVSDSETGLYTMRTRGEILKAKIDAETYTYNVERVTFEKAYSKKDQTEMIKINFIDESGLIFHNYYLCLNHQGYARHKCITHLLQMMKQPENYPLIASAPGGVNVENVLLLFNNAYDKYFKRFDTITLAPNGKYKELKSWTFSKNLDSFNNSSNPKPTQKQETATSAML
jgi:DNA repair protein RadD